MTVKQSYSIDLSAQMAVCDANFIRILQLLPNLDLGNRREINFYQALSLSNPSCWATVLEVVESFKYTSTIRISHIDANNVEKTSDLFFQPPEMLIRIYHDAKTAEVVSYQQARFFKAKYPLLNKNMYQADEKEQINFFLGEWLSFCQKEGMCSSTSLADNLPAKTAA